MAGSQEQASLRSLELQADYTPNTCPDLVGDLFVPLLGASVEYDRTTYTFTPAALSMASRGISGLVRNNGRIRLICHREQDESVIAAIRDGEEAADRAAELLEKDACWEDIERLIQELPGLDLVAWLVSQDRLDVKVACPKSSDNAVFHRKTGILTDAAGDVVVFTGSVNETPAGWTRNDEELTVFSSWDLPQYVRPRQDEFKRLWDNKSDSSLVIPIPEAIRRNLIKYAPERNPLDVADEQVAEKRRDEFWEQVADAVKSDPSTTLETTPVSLWPHQRAFWRRHARDAEVPPRVLIADEVGLGKTIQAGILLKTLANRGLLGRVLILAPATARWQWQTELRQKFNMRVPVLDRRGDLRLVYPDGEPEQLAVGAAPWHRSDWVIASYDWMRVNVHLLQEQGLHFDLVVFDEAHRARERRHGSDRRTPNQYLRLLRRLSNMSDGLLLLTATPMQIDVSELWTLLELLQPDSGWNEAMFKLFHDINRDNSFDEWRKMRDEWRADAMGVSVDDIAEMARMSQRDVESLKWLIESRNASVVRRDMTHDRRAKSMTMMRRTTSVKRSVSRYTRNLLREYAADGRLQESVPRRAVTSTDIAMADEERTLYDAIDKLVRRCYERDLEGQRNALGFVMTHFRSRLGSSVYALKMSLRSLKEHRLGLGDEFQLDLDDLEQDEVGELDEAAATQSEAAEMVDEVLEMCERVHTESKFQEFLKRLAQLHSEGHENVMVFSRFKDTQDWLREQVQEHISNAALAGLSGQGDWIIDDRGEFKGVDRARATRHIAERDGAGILLCTETAAESLNLQFCSAVVNYDIPWNPMRLEQRIGRIDRIGQDRPVVGVVNLFYKDTVEQDAYRAMEDRIEQFQANVGALQPILSANLSAIIRRGVVEGVDVQDEVDSIAPMGFDLDDLAMSADDVLDAPPRVSMYSLESALEYGMPDGWTAQRAGEQWWTVTTPSGQQVRVTPSLERYEKALGDDVEFFGPGSRAFPV